MYPHHMRRQRSRPGYDQHERFNNEKDARLRDELDDLINTAIMHHGRRAAEAISEMVAKALERHGEEGK
ncbi:MAG: hypothetical protein KDG89_16035 [Geminicoccaceae bacterium]|nr:hypothetical protein [Geminicoccaceae bacterium]